MPKCPACGLAERPATGPCPRCSAPPPRPAEDHTTVPLILPPEIGPGYLLHANYRIAKELGKGGFGRVFLARDQGLDRDVAVKFLTLDKVAPKDIPSIKERFRREAQALARYSARTRHVVSVALVGDVSGLPFFVMEFLSEGTLHDRIAQRGFLPPLEAATLVADVAAALTFVHSDGSIHRDIKPANIFVRSGQAVLGDFGIAKIADMPALTTSNPPLTPQYAAPEVIKFEATDHRADLFSLGCVLYECLTGSLLFDGESYWEVAAKIRDEREVDLSPHQYTVPQPLLDVLRRALAKVAAARYPTAAAMEKDLREIVQRKSRPEVKPAKPVDPTVSVTRTLPPTRTDDKTVLVPEVKKPGETRTEAGPTVRVREPIAAPAPSRKGRWIAAGAITAIVIGISLYLALRPESRPPVSTTPVTQDNPESTGPKVPPVSAVKKGAEPIATQSQTAPPSPTKPQLETTGSLVIDTVPPGAAIKVDTVYVGSGRTTIRNLSAGNHDVTADLLHHQTAAQKALVEAGKSSSITLTLTPSPGRLSVTSTPDGATVSVDGDEKGTTPWHGSVPAVASHEVKVSKKGYIAERRTARVSPDEEQRVEVDLRSEVVAPPPRSVGADGAAMVLVSAGGVPDGQRVVG